MPCATRLRSAQAQKCETACHTPRTDTPPLPAACWLPPPQTKYTGMRQCFRMVVREEGWRGLYRGATAPLAGAMAHNANVFFSYGVAKDAVGRMTGHDSTALPIPLVFAAGALAGVGISVVETPVDLFKIKVQGQGAKVCVLVVSATVSCLGACPTTHHCCCHPCALRCPRASSQAPSIALARH